MRSPRKLQIYTFLMCLALFFVGAFYTDSRSNNYTEASSKASDKLTSNKPIMRDHASPSMKAPTPNKEMDPVHIGTVESVPIALAAETQPSKEQANKEPKPAQYEVTASYLNVRDNADSTSKIRNVVTKGTILEIVETTEGGWLKLRSGGYVLGKYAALISTDDKQSAVSAENQSVQQATADTNASPPKKPTSNIKSVSGLTEEHIAQIFEGTALADHGLEKAVLNIEQEYGINAYFTIAVMKLESGNGNSQLARDKNNLFGLNAIDNAAHSSAFSFRTKGECVQKFGEIISTYYVNQGYTTVDKIAGKYCQANPKWPSLVKTIMNSDYSKLS